MLADRSARSQRSNRSSRKLETVQEGKRAPPISQEQALETHELTGFTFEVHEEAPQPGKFAISGSEVSAHVSGVQNKPKLTRTTRIHTPYGSTSEEVFW